MDDPVRSSPPAPGWTWFYSTLFAAEQVRRRPFDPDTLDRLIRAGTWVQDRLDEPVALDDLARVACYSRFHFLRLFQQAYAETPGRWLAGRRMARARQLLAETELPVGEVSLRVGFHSFGTFSRTFKESVGEPPIAYRRRVWPAVRVRKTAIPSCFLSMVAGVALPERSAIAEK